MLSIFLFFLVGFLALCGPSAPHVLNIRISISIIISLFVVTAAVLRYPLIIQYYIYP
jgi:hypothetical protein